MSDEPTPEQPEPSPPSSRDGVVFVALLVEGGLIALAVFAGWLAGQSPLSRFAFDLTGAAWGVAATAPLFVAFLALKRWPVGPLRSIQRFTDEVMLPMFESCSWVDLLGISCLAGLGEEMFFRGLVQDVIAWYVQPWAAVALAAALFGAMHPVTLSYAVLAALMGVYLGALYLLTGNLLAAVVAHALYDFVVLMYLLRRPSG